jgi:phosphohistidine phosphatase
VELYLVRHATAEDRETPGLPDEARRLTEQGQAEASLAARALNVMRISPKAVLTSPLRRCVETARPIAALLEAPLTTERLLAPGFEATELAAISERYADARSLILIGHEPDMSSVIRHLSGANVSMPKGGIARLEVHSLRVGTGELRYLLRPKQVRLIAAAKVTA